MVARARPGDRRSGNKDRSRGRGGDGGGVIDRIRNGASHVTEQFRSTAQAVASRAADTARDLGSTVRDEAGQLIDTQRGRAASKVRKIGSAVDKAARLLRAGRIDAVA